MSRAFLFSALFLGLVACGSDPTEGKPSATVTEPAPTPEPTPTPTPEPVAAPAAGQALKADNTNSKIEWVGAKITNSHPGGFNAFTVDAAADGGKLTSVKAVIQLDSIFSDSDRLTGHLKSDEFFNVATFATATFTSTNIAENTGGNGTHTIMGMLDLHGMQKEIAFPATVVVGADGKTKLTAEFSINRQDWGISYPGKPDDLISDGVLIKLDINLS